MRAGAVGGGGGGGASAEGVPPARAWRARGRRAARVALALAIGAALGAVLLECALRLVAAGDVDARLAAARAELARQAPWVDGEVAAGRETFAHPYLGYETAERHAQLVEQLAFVDGLGEAGATWRAEHYVVLLVGGSVARYVGDPSLGGLEPLAAALRGRPALGGREPFLMSAGRQAFKQPQQLLLVGYLLTLGLEPDAVIDLSGFNEVALGAGNLLHGLHPAWPSHQHAAHLGGTDVDDPAQVLAAAELWRLRAAADRWVRRADGGALSASVLLRAVAAHSVERLAREAERARADYRTARAAALAAESHPPALSVAPRGDGLEACVDVWFRATLALDALCRGRGIVYLVALQPALVDDGSKPVSAAERAVLDGLDDADAWTRAAADGARAGYPLLRAAGERLRAAGVTFVDASDVFAAREDTLYFDACHFHRPGTELVGARLGAALAARLAGD